MQAVYVPADDYSDPAPVAVFTHLDGTIALERSIAARGIFPHERQLLYQEQPGKHGSDNADE